MKVMEIKLGFNMPLVLLTWAYDESAMEGGEGILGLSCLKFLEPDFL
jgi:hypothetical protein